MGPEALPPAAPPCAIGGLGVQYWKLWGASVVSNLGDGTSLVAYPWLASVLTRDPVLVAGLTVAMRLPWLLFSLPAGALVDRGDRRQVMVATNGARAVLSLVLAASVATGTASLPLLYAVVVLLGCAEVLYDNAAQTILPRIVAKERLERANGTLWSAELTMNELVGPPLGGALIALGLAVPFFFDGASFAASAALILLLPGAFRSGEAREARSMRAEIGEGFLWLWRHGLLRALAVVLGIMNMLFTLVFATFVLFAQEVLGLGPGGFGVLLAVGSAGGVLGGLVGPNLSRRLGPGPSLFLTLAAGVVAPLVIGLTSLPVVVAAMSVVLSFAAVLWNTVTVALRQTIIPDHLLGRVNSIYRFFGWGMMPLGALLGGVLVRLLEDPLGREWALRAPFLLVGLAYVAVTAVAAPRLTTARVEQAKAGGSE